MNALLNYPGAKWGMAQEIVQIMPPHRSYLEPFAGTLAVLFHKPRSAIETVNDIDGDIVNFFRVLRAEPERLAREIDLTPYARAVFDDAHENRGETDFDRAVRFCIRSRMGHGFKTYQKTGFKIDVYARERSYCLNCWNDMPENIRAAAERLKEVQIENRPALELIRRFRHVNVLIYADPPYLSTEGMYEVSFNYDDHLRLKRTLENVKGKFLLSYNDCEEIRELYSDFSILDFSRQHSMAQRYEAGKEFKELLIGNYDLYERERNRPKQLTIFNRYEDFNYEKILKECILSCKIKK